MFKMIKSLQDIKKVCSNNSIVFFLTQNNKLYQNETLVFEGQDISDIRICKNDFYAFGDSVQHYLGDFINNTIVEIDFVFSSECIWRNGAIISENYRYDTSDGKIKADYYTYNFDTKQKQILFKDLQGVITSLFDDNKKAIYLFKNILRSLSLLTGLYEWELDLGVFYPSTQLSQIIGVWESVLLVSLSNDIILGISTDTGEILWEMPALPALKVRFYRGVHLDTEKGLLYCLSGNGFAVIALANQQVIQSKNDYYAYTEEITEPYQYGYSDASSEFGHSSWQGDYLYFTASKGTAFYGWLGVLHIPTMEVVWEYQNQNGETFNSQPQVADNKLYALDSGGTLHIFERES